MGIPPTRRRHHPFDLRTLKGKEARAVLKPLFKHSGGRHGRAGARGRVLSEIAEHPKLPSRVPVLGYDPLGRVAGNEASGDLRPLYPLKQTLVALQSFGLKKRTSDVRFTPKADLFHHWRLCLLMTLSGHLLDCRVQIELIIPIE